MKRIDLLNALERVKMSSKDGDIIQSAGLVIFDGDQLTSYGDNISTSVVLDSGIKAAIKYDEFQKLIDKIKDSEIELVVEENQLIVQYGKSHAGFRIIGYEQDKIPNLGIDKIDKMHSVPEDFAAALGFCCFSAGGESGIKVLENVKIDSDRIISTDKYRITVRNLSKKIDIAEPILVDQKIAAFLSNFKIVAIVSDGACAHYQDEQETIFSHRLIGDRYPDVDQFMKIEGQEIVLPLELIGALEQVKVASGDEDVEIEISKDGIKVKADKKDICWVESKVDYNYKGKKMEFKASPQHIIQILNKSNQTVINEDALFFKGENFVHSICLIGD